MKSPSSEFRNQLRVLAQSRLFWAGAALKLLCASLFGSHFATRWFAPFVYEFVHSHFADPFATFLSRGEPLAFPYGPGMLGLLSVAWLPAYFVSFEPNSHLGLLLLRLPLFAADLTICVLLMGWLRIHAREVVVAYWLSPIVFYATYIHGQLDLIPTALLCVSLFLVFSRRTLLAALVFGTALASKAHLLIAAPFVLVYLFRLSRPRWAWLSFAGVAGGTTLSLYALPLTSGAFRLMVLGTSESRKLWSFAMPYGDSGPLLYAAPAGLLVAWLCFASYRKVNRELTLMFLGAVYIGLVALVPPQPGWFLWSLPFVAYLGAQYTRAGRFALFALGSTYLAYFFVGDPRTFLEALDPALGQGFGAAAAAQLGSLAPALFGAHAANVAWTALFSATALTTLQMYSKGVQSNAMYRFRDESFMLGIGGDSGAGKHTTAQDLVALMGAQVSVVNGDDDHRWERGHAMWRRYTHLDPRGNLLEAQLASLSALRRGGRVRKRHYNHDSGRFTEPLLTKPSDFICIVGLHPFYLASQRQLFHLKIYADPVDELRREWKIARDMAQRGYTREQVLEQIGQRVSDSAKYIRPQRGHADLVLRHMAGPGGEAKIVALEIELSHLLEPRTLLESLEQVPSLEVEWEPDEALTRDRIRLTGELDPSQVALLATAVVPNLDELVEADGWRAGGRGLAQVTMLHAISARLRHVRAA